MKTPNDGFVYNGNGSPPRHMGSTTQKNTCRNCGFLGHLYKECPHPITSYGIICYRICPLTGEREFLMIQRKDSLCFMEFIRGKYDLTNVIYIKQLFKDMTFEERGLILSKTFHELWNHVWYQQFVIPRHTNEYNNARTKFETLQTGFYIKEVFVDINHIVANTEASYNEPEWGFPKGRRRIREDDITCAIREFIEETGCLKTDVELHTNIPCFEEVFFGTNNILYRHVYYVGKMKHNGKKTLVINQYDMNQVREVRAVEWFTYEETIEHIRSHNKERRQVFQSVCKAIDNL